MAAKAKPMADRVFGRIVPTSGCWVWPGHINKYGYGEINSRHPEDPRRDMTHRVSYRALVGPIPDGMTLDHLCRNRACLRPSHLQIVTRAENVMRGYGPCAVHARKTRCIRGHRFFKNANGTRTCRVCVYAQRKAKKNNTQPVYPPPAAD